MAVSEIYLLWAQLSVYLPNHYVSHKVTNKKKPRHVGDHKSLEIFAVSIRCAV